MLAESWEYIEESETWHFYLRQDITFHDGQPFTGQAVVETMNRIALSDSYAGILKIDQNSTVAVGDYRSCLRRLRHCQPDAHPGQRTWAVCG